MVSEFRDGDGVVAIGAFDGWQNLRDTFCALCGFEELGHKERGGLKDWVRWVTRSSSGGARGAGYDQRE